MTPTQVSDPAEPALPLGQASQSVTLQTCELDTRLVFEATKFWGVDGDTTSLWKYSRTGVPPSNLLREPRFCSGGPVPGPRADS